MKSILLTLLLLNAAAWAQPKPYEVAATINDGVVGQRVYRGWPLILRADVALMADIEQPVTLDEGSLTVSISSAAGENVSLPFERITALDPAPVLSPVNDSARVVWLLSSDQSASLSNGAYALRVSWGDVASLPLEFEVAEAPAELSRTERILLARLRAEYESARGNYQAAVDLLKGALTQDPESIPLLVLKAVANEALGQLQEGLATVNDALKRFDEQHPAASHPPSAILRVQTNILQRLAEQIPE